LAAVAGLFVATVLRNKIVCQQIWECLPRGIVLDVCVSVVNNLLEALALILTRVGSSEKRQMSLFMVSNIISVLRVSHLKIYFKNQASVSGLISLFFFFFFFFLQYWGLNSGPHTC
jgi:hypothetical protein